MLKLRIQLFGGRGSGGGKRAGGGGGGGGSSASAPSSQPIVDPMIQIEAQIDSTEQRIQSLKDRQKALDDQLRPLVRARNYDQIRRNNAEDMRLETQIRNLERNLEDLYKRGKALSRD